MILKPRQGHTCGDVHKNLITSNPFLSPSAENFTVNLVNHQKLDFKVTAQWWMKSEKN